MQMLKMSIYINFLLRVYMEQGRLKICDVGIVFLYGDNKIKDGFYICFVYNYRKKKSTWS